MRRIIIIVLPWLLIAVGCSTDSPPQRKLYQSYVNSISEEDLTLVELDRGKPLRAHEMATWNLSWRLVEFQSLTNGLTKDELEDQANLAHTILKHATEHQAQMLQDKWSLQMVTALKDLLTDPSDIRRASELIEYLTSSSTNQIPPWSH